MTEIEIIKKRQIEREHELSELMADFDEKALRHWIREFLLRHQSYKSSLKFDCSNLCLTWLIEDDMAQICTYWSSVSFTTVCGKLGKLHMNKNLLFQVI